MAWRFVKGRRGELLCCVDCAIHERSVYYVNSVQHGLDVVMYLSCRYREEKKKKDYTNTLECASSLVFGVMTRRDGRSNVTYGPGSAFQKFFPLSPPPSHGSMMHVQRWIGSNTESLRATCPLI